MKTILKILLLTTVVFALSGCGVISIVKGLPDVLRNLQASLQPIWQFLIALSYVLGVCFVVIAVMKLKQYGQMTVMMSTHASLGPTMAYLFVGIGLIFLPTLLDVMTVSLWGYGVWSIEGPDNSTNLGDLAVPIVQLMQVFGLIAFIRGWIMLSRLGSHAQPGTLSKGLMHIVGGILAINFVGTLHVLQATLGLQ